MTADDILHILRPLSDDDAIDIITEAIAARFDTPSLTRVVHNLTEMLDWLGASQAAAAAANDTRPVDRK